MKVSVIIPVYNTEQYIPRCLNSILSQTLQDFEIIVVNDQSPDNSLKILKEYQQKDSRIRVISNERNMGLMWTRRVGYRMALGEYIVFCDSDDYLPNTALEYLYNTAQEKNVDIVIAAYTYITVKGNKLLKSMGGNRLLSQEEVYKDLLSQNISHSLWGKIYKRSLFLDFEYETFENHTNGEDMVLFYQLVRHTDKVAIIDDSVYYYCQNLFSSTQKGLSEKQLCMLIGNVNWLYYFFQDDKCYINLLRFRILSSIYTILKYGISRKVLCQLDKNVIDFCKLLSLKRYLGCKKAIVFYCLYHMPSLSFVFKFGKKI